MFKVLSQQLSALAYSRQHLERYPTVTWIKIREFFHQHLTKHHETKINEGALKIIPCKKNTTSHFKEHCTKVGNISLIDLRFFFSQTKLVRKSNPVLIEILDSFCHRLFTFLPFDYQYSTDFEVHPVLLRFFYKKQ